MTQFSELHDASSKPWIQLSSFTALVFLLLTQNCSGLPQVVGPSQPVLATVGGDVLLSCRLEPPVDASGMSIEWSREDLDPSYVYVWWDKEELQSSKHPDYKGRTSLLVSELEFGDVSLKLSKVKPSDEGKYKCFIPTLGRGSTVELVVDDFFKIQSRNTSTIVVSALSLAASFIMLILAAVLFVCTRRQDRERKTLERTVQQEKKRKFLNTKESLLDEKLKKMKTERKLKTIIQNKIKELDEMNFDTNSDPTGSDEKNQQEELEKLQDENQKLMKTFGNLKTELQNMNQELELSGPLTVEKISDYSNYIRLKNISSEEIKLGGWKLKLQINNSKPVIYPFNESLKLQAGEIRDIGSPSRFTEHSDDVDLVWLAMMEWFPEDKLQMNLISNDGEIFKLL